MEKPSPTQSGVEFYTSQEVAHMFGVTRNAVRQWAFLGLIERCNPGDSRHIEAHYTKESIHKYAQERYGSK